MAFCVPVFFLVVLGLMEFSRMLQVQHTVRQAALEGARAGLTLDGTLASATAAATNITSAVGVISPTITVTPNPLRFFTAGKPITGTITMSREVQAISVP
jgi:Flp pilus assembly protein TadG